MLLSGDEASGGGDPLYNGDVRSGLLVYRSGKYLIMLTAEYRAPTNEKEAHL
jgi:hypothetical protein